MYSENVTVRNILERLKSMKQRRVHFEYTWDEIADYIIPRREEFRVESHTQGERYGQKIYDSTAVQSAQIATDGTQGNMVSSSFRWLSLVMRQWQEDHEVKDWLQEATDFLYYALNPTNFYEAMNEFIMDGWTIGTACMYIEEDDEAGQPVFRTLHPREIYIAENHRGRVDTVYRDFKLTARQALQEFGEYDEAVTRMAQENPYSEIEFVHAVYPRAERDEDAKDALNMRYASCYVDKDRSILVRESGYDQLPYAVWRFRKNSDEEYGRSPAWDALRDVKVLNEMVKSALQMTQKAAKPPRFVPEEFQNVWKFIPGAINGYRDVNKGPFPYSENSEFPIVFTFIEQLQDRIKQHFWVDFWQMMNMNADRQKTATEVIEMQNEKLSILTSSIGRFTNEALNPIVDNVFAIEYNSGRLPQIPQKLQNAGGKVDVDYVGPLNLAIRRLRSQGTQQALMQVLQYAQADPTVMMRFDMDEAVQQIAESYGMDQDVIRSDDDVAKILQAQQEAQAQRAQAEQMNEMARGVNPNEPVQEGSLLSQVMGR